MKRSFTILKENGAEESQDFEAGAELVLVGRSNDAGIRLEDQRTSRRHLEIRIRSGRAQAKNLSKHGFLHNDRPCAGDDEVPLCHGDILTLGNTRLRFEEVEEASARAVHPSDPEDEATRVVSPGEGTRIHHTSAFEGEGEGEDGGTVILGAEAVPILGNVPNWRPGKKPNRSKFSAVTWAALASVILVLAGGAYWATERFDQAGKAGRIEYRDPLVASLGLEYPARWMRLASAEDEVVFGTPDLAGDWERLSIRTDKQSQYLDTGLSLGFRQYLEGAAQRLPGFQLAGKKPFVVNEVTTLHYGFTTTEAEGLGLFLFNGETRIIVEVLASRRRYPAAKADFVALVQSFRLLGSGAQQYIDYPLPDEAMRKEAMVAAPQVERRVEDLSKQGRKFFDQQSVRPDNLYLAVESLRSALQWQLALSGSQPTPRSRDLARVLRVVSGEYRKSIAEVVFTMRRALNLGDRRSARLAALRAIQVVPERLDPVHQEATAVLRELTKLERANP
jgi:pSer/pThr/pTyr-binding forkhead associated (FHA) protein